jgi:hypothetical protein
MRLFSAFSVFSVPPCLRGDKSAENHFTTEGTGKTENMENKVEREIRTLEGAAHNSCSCAGT